jgi:hypothetical protein
MAAYTYLYLREDGSPYYVGKGLGRRFRRKAGRHVPVPPTERIIVQDFETEYDALVAERTLIATFGRKDLGTGVLRNLTDGGEGVSGLKHSEELKERFSRERKGRLFYKAPHKTQCVNGHEMNDENVYIHPKRGSRSCKACQNARGRVYQKRKTA